MLNKNAVGIDNGNKGIIPLVDTRRSLILMFRYTEDNIRYRTTTKEFAYILSVLFKMDRR